MTEAYSASYTQGRETSSRKRSRRRWGRNKKLPKLQGCDKDDCTAVSKYVTVTVNYHDFILLLTYWNYSKIIIMVFFVYHGTLCTVTSPNRPSFTFTKTPGPGIKMLSTS